jgi:hypothetical protein
MGIYVRTVHRTAGCMTAILQCYKWSYSSVVNIHAQTVAKENISTSLRGQTYVRCTYRAMGRRYICMGLLINSSISPWAGHILSRGVV